jgi:hypothetical protein
MTKRLKRQYTYTIYIKTSSSFVEEIHSYLAEKSATQQLAHQNKYGIYKPFETFCSP